MLHAGILKTMPLMVAGNIPVNENVIGTHHQQNAANRCTYSIKASHLAGVKKADLTAGTNSVFLPYYQNEIASIIVPQAGPDFFFTDNMSGCALFIDKLPGGDLVVYHANSQVGSDQATMESHSPSYQAGAAVGALGNLYFSAQTAYAGAMPQKALYKKEYLQHADTAMLMRGMTHEIDDITGKNFLGGTTICGFRSGTSWSFYYQNWMQVRGNVQVVYSTQFYQS